MHPQDRDHVLVVDDEEVLRDLICRMVRRCGFEGIPFAEVSAALDALDGSPNAYRAVILDHGVENSGRLHRRASSLGLPVVLISGDAGAPDDEAFADLPRHRFLQKPFTLEQIETVLGRLSLEAG